MSSGKTNKRTARLLGALVAACLVLAALAPSALAFGIKSFDGSVNANAAGTPDTQAGSHPYSVTTDIQFDTEAYEPYPEEIIQAPDGNAKNIKVELPEGLIGDPAAVPQCKMAQFDTLAGSPGCPENTQVGTVTVKVSTGEVTEPVYNLVPRPGTPAMFGFVVVFDPIIATASVRPAPHAGLDIEMENVSQSIPLTGTSLSFWGVPWAHGHDAERGECLTGGSGVNEHGLPCEVQGLNAAKPFLTLPTSCTGPQTTHMTATSWQGGEDSAQFTTHGQYGEPLGADGCDRVPFEPSISTSLSNPTADSPSGLTVDLKVPQNSNPEGLASAHLRNTEVTLPKGISINPSTANGLVGCAEGQFAQFSAAASVCPENSKIGTVEIATPLFAEPLSGSIYLARQAENPFGSLIAIYLVAEGNGVRIKLPGEITLDPITGRLVTSFRETPQLPFEEFKLTFFSGPSAVLATPVTCGTEGVTAAITPWSGSPAVQTGSTVTVSSGPNGTACPTSAATRPFELALGAGTVSNAAARHSAFDLTVSRPDGAQEVSRIDATLPKGLLATLKGVPMCADAAAAAGTCGAESQVGTVTVGAGAGTNPFYVKAGRAYLTGPYEGAPLGLDFVVPAVAGPLDLGTVNVRAALSVDPTTAQVTVDSDALPSILDGIPLRIRSVGLDIDRAGFMLNPTSCDATAVNATVVSTEGRGDALADRFQAAGCRGLAFSPSVAPKLLGGKQASQRRAHPRLQVTVKEPKGQANLRKVSLALPHAVQLDQSHIRTVCTRVQFNAEACPQASIYGYAKATTPLLAKPLEGPVYLRSSSNTLPDLVADLHGQIGIVLDGRIDSHRGGIRTTFTNIPDAPISQFTLTMKDGKRGLLVNSTDLCKAPNKATVETTGQNGKTHDFEPALTSGCGGSK